ncbi:MAG: PilZ domain-containing protein [Nitrospirae bacterium]|nr:PilZ domain-containing protein [Nitrospirota bacterium]
MIKQRRRKKVKVDIRKWYRYHFFGTAELMIPKGNTIINTTIANISMSGIGLYSDKKIDKGEKVKLSISFIDYRGKTTEEFVEGKVDWLKKFKNIYLIGIIFDEELNIQRHPKLLKHLIWLIDTFQWPQPYNDKRIAIV